MQRTIQKLPAYLRISFWQFVLAVFFALDVIDVVTNLAGLNLELPALVRWGLAFLCMVWAGFRAYLDVESENEKLRDRIAELKASQETGALLPELHLKLSRSDSTGKHQDEIVFDQPAGLTRSHHQFDVILKNTVESTIAREIDIRLEFFWRGDQLRTAPQFRVPRRSEGWKTVVNVLKQDQPAVLAFDDHQLTCPFEHPREFRGFSLLLKERLKGYFHIEYVVSSAQPRTHRTGTLRIAMQ